MVHGIGPTGGLNLCASLVLTQACQASLKKADELIGNLGKPLFREREKASKELKDLIADVNEKGSFACLSELRARLQAATRSGSAEISERATKALGILDSLIKERPAPPRMEKK